jgi:hypothetical protein
MWLIKKCMQKKFFFNVEYILKNKHFKLLKIIYI